MKLISKILLFALVIAAITSVVALILLSMTVRIENVGRIKAVGVKFYWDEACTNEALAINWGLCAPGSHNVTTLFCQNIENTPVTLNLTTNNWQPANASLYITSDWNYTDTVLQPEEVIPIEFQLNISINVTGFKNFSFDYLIQATEYSS